MTNKPTLDHAERIRRAAAYAARRTDEQDRPLPGWTLIGIVPCQLWIARGPSDTELNVSDRPNTWPWSFQVRRGRTPVESGLAGSIRLAMECAVDVSVGLPPMPDESRLIKERASTPLSRPPVGAWL